MSLLAALDQGTTSTRLIIFDQHAFPIAAHQVPLQQHYPGPGMVEHDPEDYITAAVECFDKIVSQLTDKNITLDRVKCLGISNQRETTVVWDKTTGKPVYNAIVWSDGRTLDTVEKLKAKLNSDKVLDLCGLPFSTYFAASKLRWLLDNVKAVRDIYDRGDLCFGTVDSWMMYRLTNGKQHITDSTNASRSMFMNIKTLAYDPELISFFEVDKINLPEIRSCAEVYGTIDLPDCKFNGMTISGSLGDQSAALVGHLGFAEGDAKNTYGTGCFLLYNTGYEPVKSNSGLLTTIMFHQKNGRPIYALEGSIAVAGSAIKWLKDNLGVIETSSQVGELASQVEDNAGVIFVTGFSGLFAPYWRTDARGSIFGLTQYTTKHHICRAAIEATCFQTRAILDSMVKDSGKGFNRLKVDGGMTNSSVAMQIQADILGIEVERPSMREPTALGAAIAAGLGVGVWDNVDQVIKDMTHKDNKTVFKGRLSAQDREAQYKLWQKAVERSFSWA